MSSLITQLPTTKKRITHKQFNAFCTGFKKKMVKEYGDSLNILTEAGEISEYIPTKLKVREMPRVSKTLCFLEHTTFGWCTLWLDDVDSTKVNCEFRCAGHKPTFFTFPRGLTWGKRHDLVFDVYLTSKKMKSVRALNSILSLAGEVDQFAGNELLKATKTAKNSLRLLKQRLQTAEVCLEQLWPLSKIGTMRKTKQSHLREATAFMSI
jgi:hypothetical protein